MKVAVLGGGISGLSAAWKLQKEGHKPVVFEAGGAPGGKIQSKRMDGYLLELGPHGILPSYRVLYDALDEIGLTETYLEVNPDGRNRFICLNGQPEPLPMGPGALIKTPLLSGGAKWRLLKEPFIAQKTDDESVAEFFSRRLGPEVVTRLIDPFISGVYAGDPEQLSVAAAFPMLKEFEREGGSIIRGGIKRMRKARKESGEHKKRAQRKRGGMYSFRNGLQEIPLALARPLGDKVRLKTPVENLTTAGGQWQVNGESFDGVVSTIPIPDWAALNDGLYPSARLDYVAVTVVHLAYPTEAVKTRTDGFGMLIPSAEKRRILGILFDSSLFPGRAPEGEHLFTIFMGGQRNQWIKQKQPEDLLRIAREEVEDLMGVVSGTEPTLTHVYGWAYAIPQYGFGYHPFIEALNAFEADHPNLVFAGSYHKGISVGNSFESGLEAARRLMDRN